MEEEAEKTLDVDDADDESLRHRLFRGSLSLSLCSSYIEIYTRIRSCHRHHRIVLLTTSRPNLSTAKYAAMNTKPLEQKKKHRSDDEESHFFSDAANARRRSSTS